MKRKKEVSKSQKKNYQKGKQNPLRFLSNKKLLISGSVIAYFCLLILEVWLVENFFALTSQSLWDFEVLSLWKIRIIHSIFSNLLLYMILSVIDIAVLAKVSYQLYTSFRPLEEDLVQGTMQFETVENMDKQYELVPVHMNTDKDDFFDGKPGYPVGRKPQTEEDRRLNRFYYYVDTSDSDSITLAGTRQGKGIYFVDPFIDILTRARLIANRASFVMTATKGDEPRKWYRTLKRRGYRIRVANTVNQFYSDPMPVLGVFNHYYKHYKRLREESIQEKEKGHEDQALNLSIQAEKQLANAEKMISQIAHMYFKEVNEGKDGGFWTKACRNLFKSVGMALADQEYDRGETLKVNPYTIYTVVNEMQKRRIKEKSHDFLKKYATSEETDSMHEQKNKSLFTQEETSKKMDEAMSQLTDYFQKRDETLEEREASVIEQMKHEQRLNGKNKRAMYIREKDGDIFFEPVSVFTHEKLQQRRVFHSGEKPDIQSLNFSSSEDKQSFSDDEEKQYSSDSKDKQSFSYKKDKQKINSNLDAFSRGNQRRILEQYSEATLVYGSQQWRLKNRKVKEDELANGIRIVAPRRDEMGNIEFIEILVYDVSQTEELPLHERNKNDEIESKRPKSKVQTRIGYNGYQPKNQEYELKKIMNQLRKSCDRSLQHYLNQRAYEEMQYAIEHNL